MIVGTAGHIDHGKTTLVRALTGIDTDRLKEEKERGISIELGYAYVPANDDVLGFVDVPGHERLIHTMVAGATGIDFALLVVAADDGVMPQTREHVAILDVLGVARGAVALTKTDRVDAARTDAVRGEITALLASAALRDAPLFALNATDASDAGVAALRAHLFSIASEIPLRRDDGLFRLAVDRVFTLPGHGTMAAGIVMNGSVRIDDIVHVMPAGIPARVRSIHAQNRAASIGCAGQRCALNLAGIEKSAIARGDWLADPRALAPTTRIDAHLRLFAGTRPLAPWAALHIHFGAMHRTARIVPLDAGALAPGQTCRVQLVFDAPLCAAPGDRFIARDAQAAHTIGGGVLLDPFAPARKRRTPERLRRLDALAQMIGGGGIDALLREAAYGIGEAQLMCLTGEPVDTLRLPPNTRFVATSAGRVAIGESQWQALRAQAIAALRDFHTRAPDETGPETDRLRRIVAPQLAASLWRALVEELAHEKLIVQAGPWLRLPDHVITLSADERALAQAALPRIVTGGFDPPWVRDLARAAQVSEDAMRRTLRKLAVEGAVLQVVPDLFYARETVAELARIAAELVEQHGQLDAAGYRDRIGIGRKRAIQILEFFDRAGYTARRREARILRGDSGWKSPIGAPHGAQAAG